MTTAWITTASPHVRAVANPLNAACHRGFVPDTLYVIENPGVEEEIERALELCTTIVEAYGGATPEINVTTLDSEVDFTRIHAHIRDAIEAVTADDGDVAVDITPGRKFMSAIAFTAGIRYGADHVFYLYLKGSEHYGQSYPDIPHTGVELYDFTEELG